MQVLTIVTQIFRIQFGLRDSPFDYETKQSYCSNNKVTHRGSCQGQPLRQIPMLGVLLKFMSKYIMLCPQQGCGLPCVYDPRLTVFNARGPSCVFCCEVLRKKQAQQLNNVTGPWRVKPYCILCGPAGKTLSDAQSCMYPAGVVVCKRHSIAPLEKHITETLQGVSRLDLTYDQVHQKIVSFIMTYRANKKALNEPKQKKQLAQAKNRRRNMGRR
jgi:hypothetical protein